jgi:Zn-finger nucleic acid-binding protein
MNCPVDGTELRISERQGIEIDYCPQCRGIWLDRGELDKVLERSARSPYADAPPRDMGQSSRDRDDRGYDRDRDRDYDRNRDDDRGYGKKSRRRSLLEDLLDFD